MSSLAELDPNNGERWEFAKFGEKVIAVCGHNNVPRIINFGDANFADLTGSPPNAKHIAIVRNFVVMGNNSESGTVYPTRVRWSGINDETNWTTSKVKQSDYQDLLGNHGDLQAIRGGEYGVIFMEHSTWAMEYIGPPQVFRFDETLPGIGTPAPHSVVQRGDTCFMLSQNGFVAIQSGRSLVELGANKVNKWFYDNVDNGFIERVVGVWDRRKRIVMWIFPSNSTDGLPNHGLIFDLESGRWSHFEDEIEWVFQGLGESFTLEDLDTISTSLDALPASLDSGQWISNDLELIAFDDTNASGGFNGTAMTATLDTAEGKLSPGRTLVSRVRLDVDQPSSATVASGTRASQSDIASFGSAISPATDGSYPMRSESRYHRFRASITGGFERAKGVKIEELTETGNR